MPLNYSVYKVSKTGATPRLIAETMFMLDAEAVLKNWHAGYIIYDHDFSRTKNFDPVTGIVTNPRTLNLAEKEKN